MSAGEMRSPRESMRRLLVPESIAIVGASPSGGRGATVHRNLQRFGYKGRLYPVNPKHTEVFGTTCYRSLVDIPEAVDCAIISVPAEPTTHLVEQCARLGVGSVILFASGFAEAGGRGGELQRRITESARASGMLVCGPNGLGLMNLASGIVAFSGTIPPKLVSGELALVSQSGGLSSEVTVALMERGLGFSYVISSGNEAATTLEDYLDFLLGQSQVSLVALIVEQFRNPPLFLRVFEMAAAFGKPLVVLKLGRSESGHRAVATHTGALAGDDRVLDAVFERWGVTQVKSVDELVETVTLFAGGRWPAGDRAAFVSASGGRAALIADLAAEAGVPLAEYSPETCRLLESLLPDFGTVGNPLDVTGPVYQQDRVYTEVLTALARDEGVGLLAVYQSVSKAGESIADGDSPRNPRLARLVAKAAREMDKPVVAFTTVSTGATNPDALSALRKAGVPLLYGAEHGIRAIRSALRYAAFLRCRRAATVEAGRSSAPSAIDVITSRLARHGALSEYWSKQLIAAYGIPVTREALATSADEADRLAEELGYPVALKAASARLVHKTDLGLVRLGVRDPAELRRAFDDLWREAEEILSDNKSALEGVLVQQMVEPGVELIIGAKNSDFGPVVLFGAGGVLAEAVQDTSICLAPATPEGAMRLIEQSRVGRVLVASRGKEAPDIEGVIQAIVRVSELVYDLRDIVAEVDVNPLIVSPTGAIAVDAKVRGGGVVSRG